MELNRLTPPPPAMAISGSASAASRSNFDRLEMHARQRADHFQMAQLLGADVHQQVLAVGIVAVEALDRVLHRGGELAVGAAELLQQHVAKARIGLVDANGVHQLLDVVIHGGTLGLEGQEKKMSSERAASAFVPSETTCADDIGRRSFEVDRQIVDVFAQRWSGRLAGGPFLLPGAP